MDLPALEVVAGPASGRRLRLGADGLKLGRAEDGDGRLGDDPELSRAHARISSFDDGRLLVEDLASAHGTFVNGHRINAPTLVKVDDSIELGGTTLVVVPGPPPLELRVVEGPAAGARLMMGPEPFTIGRGEAADGRLGDDPELSRRHARLEQTDDCLLVEDLGSTNGTLLNDRRLEAPAVAHAGDRIGLGTSVLEVARVEGDEPRRPAADEQGAEGGLLDGIARLAAERPKRVLAATLVFFLVAVALGGPAVGLLSSDPAPDPDAESSIATEQLRAASGTGTGPGLIALVQSDTRVTTPQVRAKVQRLARTIRRERTVAGVQTFFGTRNRAFVSRDGTDTFIAVTFKDVDSGDVETAAKDLRDELEKEPGVLVGGDEITGPTIGDQVGEDLGKAEAMAFPLLFLVSLFVFRGFVAALLPLFVGIITIFATFLVLRGINSLTPISIFALNMVIGLGLGLAIDYSLFIVSRYREELLRSGPGVEALRRTLRTAGKTIIFSSLTVAVALGALLVFPQRFLSSMGIGGAACALVAVITALVPLSALLGLLGHRVNALAPKRWQHAAERTARQEREGFWYRLSQFVMRRAPLVAAASATLLIVMGLPFLGINFTGVDASVLPADANARKVDEALGRDFGQVRSEGIQLAVAAPRSDAAEVRRYARALEGLPGVAAVDPPRPLGARLWQIEVLPERRALDDRSLELVDQIRDRDPPFPVRVTGAGAEFLDEKESIASHLPIALALICMATFILLFALTGSLVLPLKSLVMNVLTVSAAFGLLVLIFQDGRLEGLLGFESRGALDLSQPILLFAMVFGLSTDYAVFLLTRIKEARDTGYPDNEAVAVGLERTGRIVTAAAILFCIAIGSFATSELAFIKQLGVGTALAVLIDATIVRGLLVPSLMALLGSRNWWAPGPLRRLHDRFGVSEG